MSMAETRPTPLPPVPARIQARTSAPVHGPTARRMCAALRRAMLPLLVLGAGCAPADSVGPRDAGDPVSRDAGDGAEPVADGAEPVADAAPGGPTVVTLGTELGRPARAVLPWSYDPQRRYPLVVILHGDEVTGAVQDLYFGISQWSGEYAFITLLPDAEPTSAGFVGWSFYDGRGAADDEQYLRALVAEASSTLSVDAGRVYAIGHSGGGFMSYRLACTSSDVVTAVAVVAGGTIADAERCPSEEPVAVLHIHGTEDASVPFDAPSRHGGADYLDAIGSVERFAGRNGCAPGPTPDEATIDLEATIEGRETSVQTYRIGCQGDAFAELWTISGGAHTPSFGREFAPRVLEWLLLHARGVASDHPSDR